MPAPDTVPLWRQLVATASVILAVRDGVSGTAAIDGVTPVLRPGVQALAFQVWRNLGRAEALRVHLARKRPPPAVDALLCVALALAWSDEDCPYDVFTLVNQAVEAAKRQQGTQAQASFVNACLRRFLRERESLVSLTDKDPVALWNHPLWWIKRLQKDHPTHWQAVLQASNRQAPMTLRLNRRRCCLADYRATLHQAGIAHHVDALGAIVLDAALPVQRVPGFGVGDVSVQDAAAQMAAPLLLQGLAEDGPLRILDACAAPGGKTGHLLELCDGEVTALEIDVQRCERIHQNTERLGLRATVLTADAAHPEVWWDGQLFDAILLDAPCTASGIVRRHPDVRWLRRESDIAQLAALQQRLLKALWPLVRPGGHLLYCTCSLFLAEGSEQVQTFLANNTDAALLPSPGHLMPTHHRKAGAVPDNTEREHDGFFYALLQKRMAS
jgi:16S rRNA (cytosine967-C5)-methyltransferase